MLVHSESENIPPSLKIGSVEMRTASSHEFLSSGDLQKSKVRKHPEPECVRVCVRGVCAEREGGREGGRKGGREEGEGGGEGETKKRVGA